MKQKELSVVGGLIFLRRTEYNLLMTFYRHIRLNEKKALRVRDFQNIGTHLSDVYNAAYVLESMGFIDMFKKDGVIYAKYNSVLLSQAAIALGEKFEYGFTQAQRAQIAIGAKAIKNGHVGPVESCEMVELLNASLRFHIRNGNDGLIKLTYSGGGYEYHPTTRCIAVAHRWLDFTRLMMSRMVNRSKYLEMTTEVRKPAAPKVKVPAGEAIEKAFIAGAAQSLH